MMAQFVHLCEYCTDTRDVVPIQCYTMALLAAQTEIPACARKSVVRLSCGWYWMSKLKLHPAGKERLHSMFATPQYTETTQRLRPWSAAVCNASEKKGQITMTSVGWFGSSLQNFNCFSTELDHFNVLKEYLKDLVQIRKFNRHH